MRARRIITGMAALLWLLMTGLTVLVILGSGLNVIVLFAVLVCVLLGATTIGLVREQR